MVAMMDTIDMMLVDESDKGRRWMNYDSVAVYKKKKNSLHNDVTAKTHLNKEGELQIITGWRNM